MAKCWISLLILAATSSAALAAGRRPEPPRQICVREEARCYPVYAEPRTGISREIRQGGREDEPPADFAAASTDDQWVGYIVKGIGRCPAAGGSDAGAWLVEQPFLDSGLGDMARFCEYRWAPRVEGAPPDPRLLPDLADDGAARDVVRLERDAEVTAPLGTGVTLPLGAWTRLAAAFSDELDIAGWFIPDLPGGAQRTRVAVIDGAPFADLQGYPRPSRAGHADGVGSIVRTVACSGSRTPSFDHPIACNNELVEVVNYLALPRLFGPDGEVIQDFAQGGYFGSQLDVARAIAAAVDEWLHPADGQARPHLIVNLSVGWDADWSPRPPARQRVAARMAYEALRTAACDGAIVVAAAGNLGGPGHNGPMYPAAWEALAKDCPAGSPAAPAGAYDPLVYAVGGVTGADQTLAISRAHGIPRLVAPADHVAVRDVTLHPVDDGDFETSTDVQTGTSVAAAAVSGVAAAVWSLRPDLQPWEVMDLVYRTGVDLGFPADFGNGSVQPVRRVSHCRAVREACAQKLGLCALLDGPAAPGTPPPGLPTCLDRPAGQDASADLDEVLAFAAPDADAIPVEAPVAQCRHNACAAPAAAPLDFTVEPYAYPQPGSTNCPFCALRRDTTTGAWRAEGQLVNNGITSALVYGVLEVTMSDGTLRKFPATSSMLTFQYFKVPLAYTPASVNPVKGRITVQTATATYVSKDELLVGK